MPTNSADLHNFVSKTETGRSRRWLLPLAAAGLALSLGACSGPWSDLRPLPPVTSNAYHLGPGDRVRIITFGDQELTGEFRVSASGDIALPLVGTVRAAGLTPGQLAQATTQKLETSKLFRNPSVSVEVVSYRPIFVLGEVNKPGEFPYQPGMTALTSVAVAGGFTYRAIDDVFGVVRHEDGKVIEGRANRESTLAPGDVVTVYERHF